MNFLEKMVDWSEIEALQNELEEVQKESTATRLSERNCVELIMKLKELNLIKVHFHKTFLIGHRNDWLLLLVKKCARI